ncbi:hypothetical protein ABIF90_004878 [Bradyrhizobium japonicum]
MKTDMSAHGVTELLKKHLHFAEHVLADHRGRWRNPQGGSRCSYVCGRPASYKKPLG